MNNILLIDTTISNHIQVSLIGTKKFSLSKSVTNLKSQALLPLIEKILQKSKIKLSDITEIKVNTGPGSYTGIRVGLSVANALAYVLGIKVNGKSSEFDVKYE